jgi:hypothetical protein
MSLLTERLRAQFDAAAMPPPPARRATGPAPDADDAMDVGDAGDAVDDVPVLPPAAKRARVGGDDDGSVNVTSIENAALFTPLREVYTERTREDMDGLVREAERNTVHCFFCECGSSSLDLESGAGTWVVGYNLMVNYIRNNWAVRDAIAVANEVVRIFIRHIYAPCVAANDGAPPPGLRLLTVQDVLTHIRDHTRHPVVTQMLLMDTLKQLVVGLSARVFVNGVPDVKVAAALVTAVGKLDTMNDKCRVMFDKETDLVLDPVRVNALANTQRLDALQMRTADALGGATATGSSASMAAAAGLDARPSFGHPAYQQQQRGQKRRAPSDAASLDESDVALSEL